ncbi:MAG: single-stranded DNA-binding protein [Bacteriovoracaceae bacterium]
MKNEKTELFMGRLGKNPQLKYTQTQKPVCHFSVAVNKDDEERPTWHKVVVWGKQAELASQYLKKGCEVLVRGRKELKSFKTKEGLMKSYEEVNAGLVGFTFNQK